MHRALSNSLNVTLLSLSLLSLVAAAPCVLADIVDCNGVITNKPCTNGKKIAEEYVRHPLSDDEKRKIAERDEIRNAWLKNILSATATPKPSPSLPPPIPSQAATPTRTSQTVVNIIQDSNNIIVDRPGKRRHDNCDTCDDPHKNAGDFHRPHENHHPKQRETLPTPLTGKAKLPF